MSTETRRDNAGLDARIEAEERAVLSCEMCDEIGEPHVCEREWWRQRLAHMKRQECADEECLCHAAADAMREAVQLQAMVRGDFRR